MKTRSNCESAAATAALVRRGRSSCVFLAVFGALALPQLLVAEAWTVTPELNLQSGYVTNIGVVPESEFAGIERKENGGIETNASVAAELARLTDLSELRGRVRADFIRYSAEEEFDEDSEDNQYFDGYGRYKLTPLNEIGLRLTFERKFTGITTRNFENSFAESSLDDLGNDDIDGIDTDTGVSRADQVRRERVEAEPYWSIGLTQTTRLRLQYRFEDTSYGSGADVARLIDYTRHRGSVRLEHNLTEQTQIYAAVDAGTYRAPVPEPLADRENDEIALRTGLRYRFSPLSVVGLTVGARQLTFKNLPADQDQEDDTGVLFRLFGERRGQLTRYIASLGRTVTPSGTGTLVQSDIANFNFTRSLSQRMAFDFESEYLGNETVGGINDPRANRDYIRVSPILRWNWTPEWSLNLIYRYEWEDREASEQDADSHSAFFSIIYRKDNEV